MAIDAAAPDSSSAGGRVPGGFPDSHTPRLDHPEVRFRIRAANSVPRVMRVIALDDNDPEVRACRARDTYAHVEFSGPADFDVSMTPRHTGRDSCVGTGTGADAAASRWLASVDTLPARIAEWLANPDLVVIVGAEGDDPSLGMMAAEAYRHRGITVSSLIRHRAGATGDARTSDALRPLCSMMVLVGDSGYLEDLLDALGARE